VSRLPVFCGDASGIDSSITGSLILYFSLAQLPRSINLQRSLQKGKSAEDSESVGFRQIGHRHFIRQEYSRIGVTVEAE
jgi:hypothetical protein